MSIHAYHAPTGADPEIYHQIHDAIRMLANAAGLLKRAEQAADAEYKRNLQMWKDTNFGAQRAEMEDAGLTFHLMTFREFRTCYLYDVFIFPVVESSFPPYITILPDIVTGKQIGRAHV